MCQGAYEENVLSRLEAISSNTNESRRLRARIADLEAELAAAREELTDLRMELREAAECLIKDEASLAAARAEAGRLRGELDEARRVAGNWHSLADRLASRCEEAGVPITEIHALAARVSPHECGLPDVASDRPVFWVCEGCGRSWARKPGEEFIPLDATARPTPLATTADAKEAADGPG